MKLVMIKLCVVLVVLCGVPGLVFAESNPSAVSVESNIEVDRTEFASILQNRYLLRFINNSRWDIKRIYMSTTETDKWGPDQLEDEVLRAGSSFTLRGIRPGEYDIMMVDEDNDRCVLRGAKIFDDKELTITSEWLARCEKNSQ